LEATPLEVELIARFLTDGKLDIRSRVLDSSALVPTSREYTGAGFLTEFQHSEKLKWFDAGTNLRWTGAGAWVNDERIDTGYLVYVDDGYLTAVEGATYGGEPWPSQITKAEWYDKPLGPPESPPG
jgi:hypothetical protein